MSLGVAHGLAPASPFLVQHDLVQEVLDTALLQPAAMTVAGLLTAGLYVTLYRTVYKKLPTGWRAETAQLTWQELRWPVILAFISIGIGLVFIL